MLGECFDESFGIHILDGVAVGVNKGEMLLNTESDFRHAVRILTSILLDAIF